MYRCLIVEDDPQVAKLNATYLAQEGPLMRRRRSPPWKSRHLTLCCWMFFFPA